MRIPIRGRSSGPRPGDWPAAADRLVTGLMGVGTASATGFAHVLEVSAALFALGALCAALLITNPPAGRQLAPCDIAASCRDRPGVQPAVASSRSAATEPSPPQ